MIVERLANWNKCLDGPVWEIVFRALEELGPGSPEGLTRLDGDDLYMRVMSYETCALDHPKVELETHRDYIDVQMALEGSERIDWFPAEGLEPKAPYDPERDVQLFRRPGAAQASVDVLPGTFAVLFPDDAHMPKLVTARGDGHVKKVVVKVRLSLVK